MISLTMLSRFSFFISHNQQFSIFHFFIFCYLTSKIFFFFQFSLFRSFSEYQEDLELRTPLCPSNANSNGHYFCPPRKFRSAGRVGRGGRIVIDRFPVWHSFNCITLLIVYEWLHKKLRNVLWVEVTLCFRLFFSTIYFSFCHYLLHERFLDIKLYFISVS